VTQPSKAAVRQSLDKVLASRGFQGSERMVRFLRLSVEHTLSGEAAPLKEYVIGVEVFDRGDSFDPRTDTIVRVEARRLRAKLKEYYATEGRLDPAVIELAEKGYSAVFRSRAPRPLERLARYWKPALAGGLLLAAGLTAWWLTLPRGTAGADSIVVLPFANLSGGADNEYLSDGLTEEILSTLAAVPTLRVVARTSAFQFKGRTGDVRKIGKDLGVARVLEGGVRREGSRIRVTAQLISVADGLHLWSKIYDREGTSLLEIEEEITRAVVGALRTELRQSRPETTSPQAYELYLKGRYFWHKMTPEDLGKSIGFMEQALALDPNYAAAHAGLSDALSASASFESEPPGELFAKAERAARRALELDPDSAEGHFVTATILSQQWDWKGGEREFRRALDLKPSLAAARAAFAALCLGPQRRYEEAIGQIRRALETDPLSMDVRTFLGQTYVYAGQPDRAIKELRDALELEPRFAFGQETLALAYLEKASYPEALKVLTISSDAANQFPYHLGLLGYTQAKLGNRAQAEGVLKQLESRFKAGPWMPPVEVAGIHNGLGDKELALTWLERACRQRSTQLAFVTDDPRFRNLFSEPRFKAVLACMGLSR
jgi:TolB-like protein/Tfp pilus assembly protein PilF